MIKIKLNIFFTILLFSGIINFIIAQSNHLKFTHLFSEHGLSQNTVHSILQDSRGFMWFATEDGLDRYDGYNFKIYKNNPQDNSSISDNFIWTIYEDRDSVLWVGTNNGGLCKYDVYLDSFISFKNDPADSNSLIFNNVRAIVEDSFGNLWIGTEEGLDKYNKREGIFTHYKYNPNNSHSISNNVVLALYEDKDGVLWIGSDRGLDKYDRANDRFISYSRINKKFENNIVLSIVQDNKQKLWIGTINSFIMINLSTNNIKKFIMDSLENKNGNINRINAIIEDDEKMLWAGSGEGLYKYEKQKNSFIRINPDISNADILLNNNILSLFKDNSGIIWIGTAEDGLLKLSREVLQIKHYKHDPSNKESLNQNTVRSIFQEKNETLWVGTLGGGLNRLKKDGENFFVYKNNVKNKFSINDNSISAIIKDKLGFLWVGTWSGGVNKSISPIDTKQLNEIKFINFKKSYSAINSGGSNIIQSIYEDTNGQIWIGTGIGLDVYDKQNNKFIKFIYNPNNPHSLSNNMVQSCLIEDDFGNLWIGTWNGLNKLSNSYRKNVLKLKNQDVKFEIIKANLQNKFSLSDDRVISVYKDNEGNLWFGTYGGGVNKLSVNKLNSETPKFKRYNIEDGLNSNIIYCIQGDNNGNIWMSSDNGLSMLIPNDNTVRNYDTNDGLESNQFFWGASFKGNNGKLFFGGTKGFYVLNPNQIRTNRHIPKIVITDFQIFNKPLKINNNGLPLTQSIITSDEIKLNSAQNVFSIEFASLDFVSPQKNLYTYMMEGFDKEWIYSGNRRFVTYTNLDPGTYLFKVRGSNNDGIWNNEGKTLKIIISPPIWKTWWFIAFATILIGGLVASIIYLRIRNLFRIERIKTKIAADLHDNIGSSLTGISILSEVISKKIKTDDDDVKYSLKTISKNSRKLIDDLSDIVWLVNPKRESLYDLILRLRDTYAELLTYTSISFKSENIKALEKVILTMEYRQNIFLIFKEAINNSITHSNCHEIILDASIKGKRLEMTIKDNGTGFDIEKIKKGNGLDNMKRRARDIGGDLQLIRADDGGTIIKFVGDIL
ncbi:MAG: hypothetical protein CO128_07035 [Ignavibacteriales bacterium CG_4_9_14_3_um_filter_30_11]|nr:MAG: hypothetical protein CO128_07035 [Ignavibacteriales bacterium CG_4_9_14_3_um_filter_30_11]